ncbi:MAG: hypothetical protein H6622_06520 [Halobacteriovoraceae bacterium]|nr:hypothetical protein [Halobacteriovoraceae bacterium]
MDFSEALQLIVQNKWQWLTFLGIILFIIYTAIAIKNEKDLYEVFSVDLLFHQLKLKLPSWWGIKIQNENYIEFERKDTYYDWRARFKWVEDNESVHKSLKELFATEVKKLGIIFDLDTTEFDTPTPKLKNMPCLRVEGTGTQNQEDRIYYDACLIKDISKKGYYFFECHSSVLNGSLEGPYFEEVLKRIQIL